MIEELSDNELSGSTHNGESRTTNGNPINIYSIEAILLNNQKRVIGDVELITSNGCKKFSANKLNNIKQEYFSQLGNFGYVRKTELNNLTSYSITPLVDKFEKKSNDFGLYFNLNEY